MVDYVSDPNELVRRVRQYAFAGNAPDEIKQKLQTVPGVTADVIIESAELLYAHKDLLDDEGLTIAGELFNYGLHQGWTTFNQGDRSERIVAAVGKSVGTVKGKPPKDADWPEPQANRRDGRDWRQPEAAPAEPTKPADPAE